MLKKCLGMTKGLQAVATIEFCVPLVSLCIGKHKMLPIFWAARDIKRYTKYITHEGVNCRLDDEHIDNCSSTVDVVDWNIYLKTEEGQKFKDNFISTVKDIVPENFDPSVLFDLAFQEFFRKENKSQKNKNGISLQQIIKNLIKKLLPNLIVKKIQRINVNRARIALRHVGGYPFNDKVAMKDWISMARVIEGYRDL